MLREPVLQHLRGVQEAHWLQFQGKRGRRADEAINKSLENEINRRANSERPFAALCRICPTRTATGTRTASSASSASARWWTSPSPPRMSSSSAPSATPMSIPPSATTARKPSCQVRRWSQVQHDPCFLFLFLGGIWGIQIVSLATTFTLT